MNSEFMSGYQQIWLSKKKTITGSLIVLFIFLFFSSAMLYSLEKFDGNYTGFLRVRARRLQKVPFLNEYPEIRNQILTRASGYDGQFFFFMAFDPFLSKYKDQPELYKLVVDAPPYRYGRIAFAALTNFFSLDRPELFAKTMIFLILASHGLGALFFLKIVRFYQKNDYWCLSYLLVPAFIVSLNLALPESIAAAFLLGGVYFHLRGKILGACLLLALSVLTRETVILFILILSLFELLKYKRLDRALLLGCSIIPYFLWRCFLTWRLYPEYGLSTLFYTVGDFTFPLQGIVQLYNTKLYSLGASTGLLFFPVLIGANLLLAAILVWKQRNAFTVSVLLFSMMHISLNYTKIWQAVRSVERTTYEGFLFMLLVFLSLQADQMRSRWIKFALIIYCLTLFSYNLFLSSYSASYRAGFLFGVLN